MFSKLQQVRDMQKQAKQMQSSLAEEAVTVEKNGISVTIDGNLEIKEIKITGEINESYFSDNLRDVINKGLNKAKRKMAEKMQSMGGLSNFGM